MKDIEPLITAADVLDLPISRIVGSMKFTHDLAKDLPRPTAVWTTAYYLAMIFEAGRLQAQREHEQG